MTDEKTKKIKFARISNEVITIFTVLAIVVGSYYLINEFFNFRWDLTTTGQFSLSDTSLNLLKQVKEKDVRIKTTVFYRSTKHPQERLKRLKVIDLLDEYHLRSGKKIDLPKVVNPDRNPGEVERLGVRTIGTVAFEIVDANYKEGDKPNANPKKRLVYPREIWGIRMVDGRPGPEEFKGENAFSSGLKKLIEGKQHIAYFVRGHGEPEMSNKEPDGIKELTAGLRIMNFSTQPLDLVHKEKVPQDADVVIIAGPQKTFLPGEVTKLLDYAKTGGSLLILSEFNTKMGLGPLLKYFGVELGENLVIEADSRRIFQGNAVRPVPVYGKHEIVEDLRSAGIPSLLNTARSVERAMGDTLGIETFDLLMTSKQSWAEADYITEKKSRFNEGTKDMRGPITLAMVVERPLDTSGAVIDPSNEETSADIPKAKAVIFGDADFSRNEMINFGGNKDLLFNTISWLAGKENSIGISPKDPNFNFITLTNRQVWVVFFIVVIMLPGIILGFGIGKWWQRRSL